MQCLFLGHVGRRQGECRRTSAQISTIRIGSGSVSLGQEFRARVDNSLVIEGGVAGGSAYQLAGQRRATADRLLEEAKWLEALAADERTMAKQLAILPPAYALLHDLRLAGSKGNVDHLVIGPGGAFVVVIRRCPHTVEYRDGKLFADSQSLGDVLTAAEVEAQLLTQLLRTPVVGVVALLDARLPAAMPPKVAGTLVCTGDMIGRVITRGSHTLLPPHKVAEVTERAVPFLHSPSSLPRTESALGVQADSPDLSVNPVIPPRRPPSAKSVQRRLATEKASKKSRRDEPVASDSPRSRHTIPASTTVDKSGRSRYLRFVGAGLVGMCVLAVAFGSLVSTIWGDEDGVDASPTTSVAPGVSIASARDTAVSTPSTTAALTPPVVAFSSVCSVPGGGWQMRPTWPGDVPGLVRYDIELLNLDGSWVDLPAIESPLTPWTALNGQPAYAAYTVRLTTVTEDGGRLAGEPTQIVAPATDC